MSKLKHTIVVILLVLIHSQTWVFGQEQGRHRAGLRSSDAPSKEKVIPRRGFPEMIPYLKSGNQVVSMHLATIQNPPEEVTSMPLVDKLDPDLPHCSEGDVLYDITSWFPLNEMRSDKISDEEDDRWVYYNQTNGYVITNADHFLQSSVYNFVKEKLLKHGHRNRLSMHLLEVNDNVALDLESIQEAGYETLMKFSQAVRASQPIEFTARNHHYEARAYLGRDQTAYVDMYMGDGERLTIYTGIHLNRNVDQLYDFGISSAGKRSIMIMKFELVNLLGEVLYFPINDENLHDFELLYNDPEALLEQPDLEYFAAYAVPADIIGLLGVKKLEDGLSGESKLPEKYQGLAVDISDLLKLTGIDVKAIFDKMSSTLFVYANLARHDQISELCMVMGRGPLKAYKATIELYEVGDDASEASLGKNAKKLASLGSVGLSGQRFSVSRNGSVL